MNIDTQNFESPFLNNRERVLENEFGFVIYDGFPVSEGHCLIVPYRVYSDYFESTEDEVVGLQKLIIETKKLLDKKFQPNGYNVGINCGEVAGQTVPHVHIHLIPRYKGDMDNPRGGVRGVIPSKQKY
ncbi:HIT family protein [Paracoccaceae bacterium]|nr:HIT family protein [Paracoccaceae bacterium]